MTRHLKENFLLYYIALGVLLGVSSTLYNYKHSDPHINSMINIANLITQNVGKADEYGQKFSYIGLAYYNMQYVYYAPYENQKSAILNNLNNNKDFALLEENIYVDSTSAKYCYGVYNIIFHEMLDGSRIGFHITYNVQSECYKNNNTRN